MKIHGVPATVNLSVIRKVYGYDYNQKPQEPCVWDDFFGAWIETDQDLIERLKNKLRVKE